MKHNNLKNDFGIYFHQKSDVPVFYQVRNNYNMLHDIIYMDSYIHDATFNYSNIAYEKNKLVLKLNRIRWELFKYSNELVDIKSQLAIKGMRDFWITSKNVLFPFTQAIEIKSFYLLDNFLYIKTAFSVCDVKIQVSSRLNISLKDFT